jgi:hypothetical protein
MFPEAHSPSYMIESLFSVGGLISALLLFLIVLLIFYFAF